MKSETSSFERGIDCHSGEGRNLKCVILDPGSESGMTGRRERRGIKPVLRNKRGHHPEKY